MQAENNIQKEMTDDEYFALAALSKSQVKKWNPFNPMTFFENSAFNPNKAPEEISDYIARGKLYHTMLFEKEQFEARFVVNDDLGKMRKNKKWQAAQEALGRDKMIITSEELERAKLMMLALSYREDCREIFSGGALESPYLWHDKEWDIPCKMKLDYFKATKDGLVIVDYKTTSQMDANTRFIDKAGHQFDVGMYTRGLRHRYAHIPDMKVAMFIFVFQSTNEGEEHDIRIKVVRGDAMQDCENRTSIAVSQILPRLKAWQQASAVVLAETDPEKAKEELAAKEAAMLKAWLPKMKMEDWMMSPWSDREISAQIQQEEE